MLSGTVGASKYYKTQFKLFFKKKFVKKLQKYTEIDNKENHFIQKCFCA